MSTAYLGMAIDSSPAAQAARELRELGNASVKVERDVDNMVDGVVVGMHRLNGATEGSLKSTNNVFTSIRRLGSGTIQNASWQIGDMAVQFQTGTAAATVFAQQLPQLASSFGAVGAVIGTGLAISIPLVAMAFRGAKEEADTLSGQLGPLQSAIQATTEAFNEQEQSASELLDKYGMLSGQTEALVSRQSTAALNEAKDALNAFRNSFDETINQVDQRSAALGPGLENLTIAAFNQAKAWEAPVISVQALMDELILLKASTTDAADISALSNMLQIMDDLREATGELPPPMQEFYKRISESLQSVGALHGRVNALTGQTAAAAGAAAALANNFERAAAGMRAFRQAEAAGIVQAEQDRIAADADLGARKRAVVEAEAEGIRQRNKMIAGYKQFQSMMDVDARDRAAQIQKNRDQYLTDTLSSAIDSADTGTGGGGGGGGGGASAAESQAEKDAKAYRDVVDAINLEISALYDSSAAQEINRYLRQANVSAMSEEGQNITMLVNYYQALKDEMERVEGVNEFLAKTGADWMSSLLSQSSSVDEMLSNLLAKLGEMALYQGMLGAIANSGVGASGVGQIFTSLFGIGAREFGGPVSAGVPYIVGEKRPEVFVPDRPGTILPHVPSGGGGSSRVDVNVVATVDDEGSLRTYVNKVSQRSSANTAMAVQEMNRRGLPDSVHNIARNPRRRG